MNISGEGSTSAAGNKQHKSEAEKPSVAVDLSTLVQEVVNGVCLGSEYRKFDSDAIGTLPATDEAPNRESEAAVIINIDKRAKGWVFQSQPAALKRIINNIAGNAIKYTDSGWVNIRLRARDIDTDQQGNSNTMIKISISDSGCGISREFLKTKLFTPFSQENPLVPGAGLGMSIVRQIVEGLGGQIDVRSQVGRGTKVTIRVTLKQLGTDTKPKTDPEKSLGFGMKLRLVGFPTYIDTQGKHSKGDARNLLRLSVQRCAKSHFGMQLIDDGEPDIIIVSEMTDENRLQLSKIPGDAPAILLCDELPKDIRASFLPGRISTCLQSKPFGPGKLAERIDFCFNEKMRLRLEEPTPAIARPLKIDTKIIPPKKNSVVCFKPSHPTPPVTVDIQNKPESRPEVVPTKQPAGVQQQQILPKPDKGPKKPSILAVEDNKINLMLLTTFLKKKGYAFGKAVNGLEGYEMMKSEKETYDVVLMDLRGQHHPSPWLASKER